jgi:UDP-N-acetylglucosamine 2-epimerase (non-hydrolysing)
MLDQVLRLFEIEPDIDLNVMRPNQTLSQLTALLFTELDAAVTTYRPDWILVHGDTTTALVASIVASYHQIQVGHVEAGLRTWDRTQPFPEEMNRVVVDRVCDLYFAPTERARQNLLLEGAAEHAVHVTGNTVIDALLWASVKPVSPELQRFLDELHLDSPTIPKKLVLVTAHRRENFGQGIEDICDAIKELAGTFPELEIVYPVHRNPNIKDVVYPRLSGIGNVHLLEPLDYLPMVHLLKRSHLVLTDSGGLQEESPTFGVPVLVMRDTSERPEALEAGTARLVGTSSAAIVDAVTELLLDTSAHSAMAQAINPFGAGDAGMRIARILLDLARSASTVAALAVPQ